ncbi:hypothetical protein K469DRAFT_80518 [Zopfia rhizophila CBS 207.26]|uniref:Uncharacterized protein n=1 Tax=Zopfia rhizophila CBS 207.26 TaxID=1314779 RepID=A0A6A6D6L9_9PEZI|nr:hypothetical protein K469DRAFT_80518 [Zopfia rhizophila CBS 207.26]
MVKQKTTDKKMQSCLPFLLLSSSIPLTLTQGLASESTSVALSNLAQDHRSQSRPMTPQPTIQQPAREAPSSYPPPPYPSLAQTGRQGKRRTASEPTPSPYNSRSPESRSKEWPRRRLSAPPAPSLRGKKSAPQFVRLPSVTELNEEKERSSPMMTVTQPALLPGRNVEKRQSALPDSSSLPSGIDDRIPADEDRRVSAPADTTYVLPATRYDLSSQKYNEKPSQEPLESIPEDSLSFRLGVLRIRSSASSISPQSNPNPSDRSALITTLSNTLPNVAEDLVSVVIPDPYLDIANKTDTAERKLLGITETASPRKPLHRKKSVSWKDVIEEPQPAVALPPQAVRHWSRLGVGNWVRRSGVVVGGK